ncbi:GNAT family N-acetyltransferase [Thioclava sediminum]|uniref:GNAT family N-acetyltransferase n=1 Tax=Thioclava sediminum TaxID=1915319 RepID=UPI000997F866
MIRRYAGRSALALLGFDRAHFRCHRRTAAMLNSSIEIGDFRISEADQLGVIFFDAVREGAREFYNFEQRRAWASGPPSGPNWASRLTAQRTVVARLVGQPVGFMTLDDDGYIDLAFVAPGYQRQGVGGSLYARIEAIARDGVIARLHSHASYLARGLFEQQGWDVVREQKIERAGVTLTNFLKEKRLHYPVRRTGIAAHSDDS